MEWVWMRVLGVKGDTIYTDCQARSPRFDPPLEVRGEFRNQQHLIFWDAARYFRLIAYDTGHHLSDIQDPRDLIEIADRLSTNLHKDPTREREDLIRMFRAYGTQGWTLFPIKKEI